MVFCGNKEHWTEKWKHAPRVQVTNSEAEFRRFLVYEKYDKKSDSMLGLPEHPHSKPAIEKQEQVWYAWRPLANGVAYGGTGSIHSMADGQKKDKQQYKQATGKLPSVPMEPASFFES